MAATTFIISVVGGGQDTGTAELDWEAKENLGDDGKIKSNFLAGEEAVFLVNTQPGWEAVDVIVHSKCGGGYIEPGSVTRSRTEAAGFDTDSWSVDLQYWPKTAPAVALYTWPATTMSYVLTGKKLSPKESEELPIESVINYTVECQRVRYIPPPGLDLADQDDTFPVRIEILVEEQ